MDRVIENSIYSIFKEGKNIPSYMSKVDYRQKGQMVVVYISLNSHVKVKRILMLQNSRIKVRKSNY